jgi:aryl-alcohol dehydrogenase-like predicted oxidoreductase
MQTKRLGTTDLSISPLGFGARAAGGADWPGGLGQQDDGDSIATINRALDLGINWIDTAPVYGLGHSEEVVGRAIKGRSNRPYIFTKCGVVWDAQGNPMNDLKRASLRLQVEDSLRRLGIETIDLMQIHFPVPDADIEEGWTALAELQGEGKIRHLGVSNFDVNQLRRIQAIAPVASVQAQYSLVAPGIEGDILPFAEAHGIGVLVYQPMHSGLLSGSTTRERVAKYAENDYRRTDPEFQEPRLSHNLDLVEKLRAIGQRHGRISGEVAIAWTLRQPAVTGAIIGGRRPDQVEGIAGASGLHLTLPELDEIVAAVEMPAMVGAAA